MARSALRWAFLLLFGVLMVVPFLWLVMSSFKTNAEIFTSPFELPSDWSLHNYVDALAAHPVLVYIKNSAVVSVLTVVIAIAAALLASYVLMHRFTLERTLSTYLMFGIVLPVNAFITPVFFLVRWMGLFNSVWGLALVYAGIFFPTGFLIVKSYVDTIPKELLEAARADGASFHAIFARIVVPLSVPGLVTAAIFLMMLAWNELLFASILTLDQTAQTVQVGVRYFLQLYAAQYPQAFAATVMAMLPPVVVYLFLSDRVIAGMSAGSLK